MIKVISVSICTDVDPINVALMTQEVRLVEVD